MSKKNDQLSEDETSTGIAIVGMACRFPGAEDLAAYWSNLTRGVESIRQFRDDELRSFGVPEAMLESPGYVRAGAQISDVRGFDRGFFGYSPREASLMDPQQRIFLETAWHAMEHAGQRPNGQERPVGIFAGTGLSTYLLFNLSGNPAVTDTDTQLMMLGNDKDFLSARTAYHLNCRGPVMTVQTGCSTSLVATHLACDALLSYECDTALAGGVCVVLPERLGYQHVDGGTASSDGHCRAFDAEGDGTVFGSGAGAVVLKRLDDAIADGDTIYAVILGSAVNNDGSGRVGFTAPSIQGQAEVIVRALEVADVHPRSIGYVEAHGTATRLGDPAEITALTRAFRMQTQDAGFCAVGSVKTNIGHLDAAAGVASLIKTTLAIHHATLPPSLNFENPNPEIDLERSPFYVNAELADWPASGGPRRAGVSAFGYGGTNAHLVLGQAPERPPSIGSRRPQLLVCSAQSAAALDEASIRLAAQLSNGTDVPLADLAHTMQLGRAEFAHRQAVACRTREEAAELLTSPGTRVRRSSALRTGREVAFMIPGLGDHYEGMGAGLYHTEPVYRDVVDRSAAILQPLIGQDIRTVLTTEPDSSGTVDFRALLDDRPDPEDPLNQTLIAHPALFVTEYALARLWMSWGIRPSAMIGHSLGEYVAATLAGVFSLEDALRLVAERARLIDRTPPGALLAVPLSADELAERIDGRLSCALLNGPRLTVVAGPVDAIEELELGLSSMGDVRRLQVSRAFHSPLLEPVVAPITELVRTFRLARPSIPFIADATGTWITDEQATDPGYWGAHSARVVDFAAGIAHVLAGGDHILLETGPGQSLSALAADAAGEREDPRAIVPSMRPRHDHRLDDSTYIRDGLGQLWLAGASPDWDALHGDETRLTADAPLYPFQHETAWISMPSADERTIPAQRTARGDSRSDQIGRWFWQPGWQSLALPPPDAGQWSEQQTWLVLTRPGRLGEDLVTQLRERGQRVVVVTSADEYRWVANDRVEVRADSSPDHERLLAEIAAVGQPVTQVLHLWLAGSTAAREAELMGYHNLMALGGAIARAEQRVKIWFAARGFADVESSDVIDPPTAMALGACRCLPQETEFADVSCIDLGGAQFSSATAAQLIDVLRGRPDERTLALRGRRLWRQVFERADPGQRTSVLPEGGTFLLTGGLGRIGLDLASHLAREYRPTLIMVGRGSFPAAENWDDWLASHSAIDPDSVRIRRLRDMVSAGATVVIARADVTDEAAVRDVFKTAAEQHGGIDAVIHLAGLGGLDAFVPLSETTTAQADAVMRAKTRGADVLASVLIDHDPTVVLLVSSNAAVLGGVGTSAYAAANVYLDMTATSRERMAPGTRPSSDRRETRWVSVNLEQWLTDDETAQPRTSFTQYGIPVEDGVCVLQAVLDGSCCGQITVMTGDLHERIDQWITNPVATRSRSASELAPRPDLSAPFAALLGEDETSVAALWEEFLGISGIGRDDNFYELGGHSLMATQIVTRARAAFGREVSLLSLLGAPTVAEFTAKINECDPQADVAVRHAIPVASRNRPLPLSYAQRRFWYFDQLAPESSFYNITDVVRIAGPLDAGQLEAALGDVVARQEVLRSAFVVVDGEPCQEVRDGITAPLRTLDLRDVPETERESRWQEVAQLDAARPFRLSDPPFLRATSVRLDELEHVLLLTMHHSISDGWSIGVFVRELSNAYARRTGSSAEDEPDLPIQYADFAVWQRENLTGDELDRLLGYWRDRLAGAPPLSAFPADSPRPPEQSFRGRVSSFDVDPALLDRVYEAGAMRGCTPFMTLLAIFFCVLRRLSGQQDLVVGSPIAGRTRAELENLVGTFVNMLPIRVGITPGMTFDDVLEAVRGATLGAYEYQELPFEMLVDRLAPERSLSYGPVFQNVFVLQNAPLPPMTLGGLRLKLLPVPVEAAKFDLMLAVREVEGQAEAQIEYAADLFSPDTVGRIWSLFDLFLTRVAEEGAGGTTPVLDLADETERATTDHWGGHGPDSLPASTTPGASIPALLSSAAARAGDRVALIDPISQQTISFLELEHRSNRLARQLRAAGLGPERLVGVNLPRTPDSVVLLTAVLKAGAAYVPLDPAYPADRLKFMVSDASIDLVVTDDPHGPVAQQAGCATTLAELDLSARERDPSPIGLDPGPLSAAYVIYTSGSSGQPKGVIGLHRGMLERLHWMWREFPFQDGETLVQKTSFNFLDSFWEIFGALGHGIPLVVAPDDVLLEPARFIRVLAEHCVSRIVLVPSLLRTMLEAAPSIGEELPELRLWVSSGEALQPSVVTAFGAAAPGRTLLNLYGSSELSADVSWHVMSAEDARLNRVPIGRPITGSALHLLDETLRPVPIGTEGDLYVSGLSLCRGYLDRPDLTADCFVPDPRGDGSVLYRTGDRARWAGGGVLEYRDRSDMQVKVRGFRIELGEVEAGLLSHPDIVAAAVTAADDRLTAHCVLRPGRDSLDPTALHRYLSTRLPGYMVPAAYRQLDRLPLTSSGKIDRTALGTATRMVGAAGREEPQTDIEHVVAGLWQAVLETDEPPGVLDNFFAAGGYSLLASKVVLFIREAFQVPFPLRTFLDTPTIRQTAAALADHPDTGPEVQARAKVLRRVAELSDNDVDQLFDELARERGAS